NYQFRISIDTGTGFQQIDSKSCMVVNTQPRYIYSGAWVCDSIAPGPAQWSQMAVNTRTNFEQGSKVSLLVEYKNIYVNHRHKVDIYYNGAYSWTWGNDQWLNVGQWGWGYSYVTPYITNCQAGEYEFRVFIDTGAGYYQMDSKTFTVTPSGPGYTYSGAWICDSATDGSAQWSKVPANVRTRFVQGGNICCLAVFNNVFVNHRIKVDIYKDGAYSWTWGNGSWNVVSGTWAYSNAIVMNQNVGAGQYEFRIFIDIGNGYQQVDSKNCSVDTSGPPYTYKGSWTCDSVADSTDSYSKVAVNAKTNFVAGQTMYCLSVFKNVYVNHRIKVDVYKDGFYSWTWGNGDWNVVSGTWAYSNAIVTNSQVSAGQYQFRIYIDTGSGYQQIDTKNIAVSSN
ncbi:MAG TPA: hypothetical protein VMC41_02845, partial [Candidatus Nanoarchaeia archaeon]|nr:hypothetical protein [Candidatus Nanoarchaeia archaeon]